MRNEVLIIRFSLFYFGSVLREEVSGCVGCSRGTERCEDDKMKRAGSFRPFSEDVNWELMIRGCSHGGSSFSRLRHLPVVLNEIKLFSVSVASVEVVLQHLRVDLVVVPMIVIETI